jgi:hypothetical protein
MRAYNRPLPELAPRNWRDRLGDPRKGVYNNECALAWIAARRKAHREDCA